MKFIKLPYSYILLRIIYNFFHSIFFPLCTFWEVDYLMWYKLKVREKIYESIYALKSKWCWNCEHFKIQSLGRCSVKFTLPFRRQMPRIPLFSSHMVGTSATPLGQIKCERPYDMHNCIFQAFSYFVLLPISLFEYQQYDFSLLWLCNVDIIIRYWVVIILKLQFFFNT